MANIITRIEVMRVIKGAIVYVIEEREKTVVGEPPSVTRLPVGIRYENPDPSARWGASGIAVVHVRESPTIIRIEAIMAIQGRFFVLFVSDEGGSDNSDSSDESSERDDDAMGRRCDGGVVNSMAMQAETGKG